MSRKNISAMVSEDLLKRLDVVAKETERNRSWLVSKAIDAYLDELEDVRIAKGRLYEERLSPSEMRKKLGV